MKTVDILYDGPGFSIRGFSDYEDQEKPYTWECSCGSSGHGMLWREREDGYETHSKIHGGGIDWARP